MTGNLRNRYFSSTLIWLGAGLSITEILTGTLFAPMGLFKGLVTILAGHVAGCILLYYAGLISAKAKKGSMDSTKISFGKNGGRFFAFLNLIQLTGWIAILNFDGAASINQIFKAGIWFWALIIGLLIGVWIFLGVSRLGKINTVVMTSLFILTVITCFVIVKSYFHSSFESVFTGELSFGQALELAIAMPLSWVPVIGDFTKDAEKPHKESFVSSVAYFVISCWMYIIGFGLSLVTKETDLALIMLKAGLGIVALVILVFSCVTTNFLASFSAGHSATAMCGKISSKYASLFATGAGTLAAMFLPVYNIEHFLFFISSVFTPMIAILMADFFVLKKDVSESGINIKNAVIWVIGFAFYRFIMGFDFAFGSTIPCLAFTFAVTMIAGYKRIVKK